MKKIIALVLCIATCLTLAIGLTSCAKGKSLAEIQAAGKLVVATSPDFPPFESKEGNAVVGIEVDIMNLICAELGVELEVKEMDFDAVLVGVSAGKYDCGMSGITASEKRKKNMLFTVPYYNAAQVIVVKEGSTITGKADLEGKTVSVQTGTTAEQGCIDEGIDVLPLKGNGDAMNALKTDKVSAWVVDNLTAIQMVQSDEGEGLVILDEKMTDEPYAFSFAFGSEDLVEAIDAILNKLIENGKIEEIFAKYGETYFKP